MMQYVEKMKQSEINECNSILRKSIAEITVRPQVIKHNMLIQERGDHISSHANKLLDALSPSCTLKAFLCLLDFV